MPLVTVTRFGPRENITSGVSVYWNDASYWVPRLASQDAFCGEEGDRAVPHVLPTLGMFFDLQAIFQKKC